MLSRISRRGLLAGSVALPFASGIGVAAFSIPTPGGMLWYRRPAATWNEALPLGNGRLGAMIFGRVGQERLQLNESSLWAGAPYTPDNSEAKAALPEVRALIAAGKFKEAEKLASERVMAKPLWQMSYGTLGDLLLTFADASAPTDYRRQLDLGDAIASTFIQAGNRRLRRECFTSAVDQVIVLRLDANAADIAFELGYRGPRTAQYASPDYSGPATTNLAEGPIDWLEREEPGASSADVRIQPDGANAILITGRNESGPDVPAGLHFALRIVVLGDGEIGVAGKGISVRGSRAVTVLVAAATSFVNYRDVSGDPIAKVRATSSAAAAKSYSALRRDHVTNHRALFDRVSLDLGTSAAAALPTNERIASAERSDDPALAALYFQFARYLLIASSRPGGQPANLQGLWNEGVNPPWGSKYTININTEMNYWPADAAGLGECVEPLLRMVEDLSVTGAATARTMYGARGWVAHHNTDLWRAAAPIDGPAWGLWPCGGAWLCNTLWTHWEYQQDPRLLVRLYPLLRGAAMFFLDTLIEDPKGRGLITSPSISPENQHPFGAAICAGPAMDRQIVRDLFSHTAQAARQLGRDASLATQLENTRKRIAPDRIGVSGQFQEWLEDWDADAPDIHHRHVSHLYAVYPSGQANVRDTPALIEAAKVTLRQRGDLSTGWATAWRACLWARMGEGDHAHAILKGLFGPMRTYPNLFDAHPPFQIDGNFGGTAAIQEMLVQSWGGEIRLLPALPKAWPNGTIRGSRVRGGLMVDLTWRQGKVARFGLRGRPHAGARIRANGLWHDARLNDAGTFTKAFGD